MDPYKTLEVESNSSTQEIKKAYKKKAAVHHPDKGGDEEEFHQIKLAYNVLSDPERREKYDKTGKVYDSPKVESTIESNLTELFAAIIEQEHFKGNIIDNAKHMVSERISALSSNVNKTRKKLNKLEKNKNRIKVSDGQNIFQILIDGKIYRLTQEIDNMDSEISIAEKVLSLLVEYEDMSPEEKQDQWMPFQEHQRYR